MEPGIKVGDIEAKPVCNDIANLHLNALRDLLIQFCKYHDFLKASSNKLKTFFYFEVSLEEGCGWRCVGYRHQVLVFLRVSPQIAEPVRF